MFEIFGRIENRFNIERLKKLHRLNGKVFFLKLSFIHIYKKFYNQVKIIGIMIALLTIGMIGTSAGYYLLITKFGSEIPMKKIEQISVEGKRFFARTDPKSITKGKELYESKCYF
jgi:hypothetical protein